MPNTLSIVEDPQPDDGNNEYLYQQFTLKGISLDIRAMADDERFTLDKMMERDCNIPISQCTFTVYKNAMPFCWDLNGEGVAFRASTRASTGQFTIWVPEGGHEVYIDHLRRLALSKAFAREFNALIADPKYWFDFSPTTLFESESLDITSSEHSWSFLEPAVSSNGSAKYGHSYTDVNSGIVDGPTSLAAEAFTHFTFERSKGRFMVSNLVADVENYLNLKSSTIHTLDNERLGSLDSNKHERGFESFFSSHHCNNVQQCLAEHET
ncbi:hypothetical protein Dda_7291 [Drechslerella dactyloides]|uniref:Alpha-type protein kinase domain-containing protein n=1 Tax=Drechslerella dactyloides TaxID=74499 RepID=A0AAD6IVE3_DREDA|nr:hypothetical protein Dda_7291 [Drechslerella dactyloides]